jgi:polysaccharide biosynthesis protein PslG
VRQHWERSRRLISVLAVVLGCGLGAGLLWHNKASEQAGGQVVSRHGNSRHHPVKLVANARGMYFGVSDPDLINEPLKEQSAQLRQMSSIGLDSIRFDANWRSIQYGGPHAPFNWTALDQEVSAARAAKMTIDLIIDGCPSWARYRGAKEADSFPRPASAQQFANFAAKVAARYAPDGVKYFEIWNEPNDTKFWQPVVNPAFYTRMLIDSYRAIKTVDSSAYIIVGGLAPIWDSANSSLSGPAFLSAIYKDGAEPYFDAVATHPYSFPALPGTYESWSAWSQMSLTAPSLRSIMKRYGDWRKPIWITEFGAPSNGPGGVGVKGEAAELSQAIKIARATRWIGALYIYTWQDAGTYKGSNADWFGLLNNRGQPKVSYADVAKALGKTG